MTGELDLSAMRTSYQLGELRESAVAATWPEQFDTWFAAAKADTAVSEPNAVQLATADAAGRPSVRTVLVKGVTSAGLVVYTHYDSPKGRDLADNPYAAAVFAWLPQQRQVRFHGAVTRVPREETEAYFAARPRGSQVGAWATAATGQSAVVAGRGSLDAAVEDVQVRFAGVDSLPPPPDWGGYLLRPDEVEFWQGRDNRMHDRIRYRRLEPITEVLDKDNSGEWVVERLAP